MGEAGGGFDSAVKVDAWPIGGEAVERLRPPLVWGNAEPGDGGGVVGELLDFFVECEEGDEGLGSGFEGKRGVAEGVRVVVGAAAWILQLWDWFLDRYRGRGTRNQLEEV